MNGWHTFRISLTGTLLAMGALGLTHAAAWGQGVAKPAEMTDAKGYKYLAPYIDPSLTPIQATAERAKIRTAEQLIRRIFVEPGLLAANRIQFDFYYTRMYLPDFTQTTDAALKNLPVERQKLFRNHLEECKIPQVHKYLVELILAQMKEIVQDNYHPACRYNAMLTISALNSVDAENVGPSKSTPEPLIDALPFILEQFTKPDNSDAIRLAALLGLVRHLEWDNFRGAAPPYQPAISAPQRDAIVKELLALAVMKEPPAGRDAAGHEWFRRRAIEGLAHANYNQVDPAVGAAFEALLKDESESLTIRCAAATAIGKVAYAPPAKLEPMPTAKELGYLALVACDKELGRVTNLNKDELDKLQRLSGAGGGYGSGSSSYEGAMGAGSMRGGRGSYPDGPASGTSGRSGRGGPSGRSGPSTYPGATGSGRGRYPGASGGPEGMSSESGYLTVPEDPKQYRFELVRRRLRSQLYAVEVGLSGPDVNTKPAPKPSDPPPANPGPPRGVEAIAKGTADEAPIKDIILLVGKLVEAVENTDTDMAALEKEVRKQMKPLELKTRKLAAPTPVEVPSDVPVAPGPPPVPGKARPASTPAPPPAADAPAAAPAAAPVAPASPAGTPTVTPAATPPRAPAPSSKPVAPPAPGPAPAVPAPASGPAPATAPAR
jgi:hypothetical protein